MFAVLGRIPWIFLLILYLIAMQQMNLPMEGAAGYTFVGLAMVVMFIEFMKSGDISTLSFFLDTLWSVIALIVSTGLLCYMVLAMNKQPEFFHWLGYGIIIGDAVLSPANAFRTALRNFSGSVN